MSDDQATKEVKAALRRFSRIELEMQVEQYIRYDGMRGKPCKIIAEDIKVMTDNQLRKFIYESDFPGEKWIR
ncbi:hypothetical protein [Bacillus cereus]|uniref:hypothetical protein n=1 Tax=Bacillus cereus TaxID=1396 RepID=UPI003D652A1E